MKMKGIMIGFIVSFCAIMCVLVDTDIRVGKIQSTLTKDTVYIHDTLFGFHLVSNIDTSLAYDTVTVGYYKPLKYLQQ